jgi:hypothetical protein
VHNQYDPPSPKGGKFTLGRKFSKTCPLKPDAFDQINNVLRELKPNNARQIAKGLRQLKNYADEIEKATGSRPTSYLDTYNSDGSINYSAKPVP